MAISYQTESRRRCGHRAAQRHGQGEDGGRVNELLEELHHHGPALHGTEVFLLVGRNLGKSAVVTLTDGKPSFLFQTAEKVMQLKDEHTKPYFVPATELKDEEPKLMHQWASRPWN